MYRTLGHLANVAAFANLDKNTKWHLPFCR
jgi:hypothetical protein